mmetsp:Transcript_96/g.175  ORF Transcript_96/g.175 Transcript_96/m.175 type:complete len:1077 (+) Transcript_96:112-3342(+)
MVKCYVCRFEEVEPKKGERYTACERCEAILKAPPCKTCGQPVRDAKKNDPEPYHDDCRRCSSCHTLVKKENMHRCAGKILCGSCEEIFGGFFVPLRRSGQEYMKEAFKAWDADANGCIEKNELRRVLQAIMPNFSDRDLNDLMRIIDTNGNGVVEYEEFCAWVSKENPLEQEGESFSDYISMLMREAGSTMKKCNLGVEEVQVRSDGVYFKLLSGTVRQETTAFCNEELQLTALDPEEFISKIECVEDGLKIGTNTGRSVILPGTGETFGPFAAPTGFHIEGFRVKPLEAASAAGAKDFVSGVDLAPLPAASIYDAATALLYTAEQEYLRSLREILAKAAIDVNSFGAGGATALMLAAGRGSTGSIRLLISSKANPNLADADGWTALTYASRCGSSSAVQALVEKGAKEGDASDNGKALHEALRSKNNSTARALLRAGFGPQPKGTFALEVLPKPEDCKVAAPKMSPAPGAFSKPTKVSFLIGEKEEAKDAASVPGMQVLYSLDGRDPILAGDRYLGPFMVSGPSTQVRAVAVVGPSRSIVVQGFYVVCHSVLPDEIVSAGVKAKLFPGIQDKLKHHTTTVLDLPVDRMQGEIKEVNAESGGKWLQASLRDLKPRHRLKFDMAFATIKSNDKKKAFVDKFVKDLDKALGESPEDVKIFAGSIIVEFEMTRDKAEELARMLGDPTSHLLTKAKLKKAFKTASLQVIEALGPRLSELSFREELQEIIKTKATKPKIYSIGAGDEGCIACCVPDKKQVKAFKPKIEQAIKKKLEDVEFAEIQTFSEELEFDFTIDIMDAGMGTAIVEAFQKKETMQAITDNLGIWEGIDTEVSIATQATSRKLADLEFVMKWNKKEGTIQEGLDCSCVVYAEEHLVKVMDFEASLKEMTSGEPQTKDMDHTRTLGMSLKKAMNFSIDPEETAGQECKMNIDISALPAEVTDLFFVMSAFEADDMSGFDDKSISVIDVVRGRELISYGFDVGTAKAAVVCNLSRNGSGWVFHALGTPAEGTVREYEPILRLLAEKQNDHLNWERRKDWVELRVLHKLSRMNRSSDSDLGMLFQSVLDLPVAVFQLLVKML